MPSVPDVGIAVVLALFTAAGSVGAAVHQHPPRPLDVWGYLLIVAAAAAIAWRRAAPVWALWCALIVVNGYLVIGYAYGPIQLCMMVAMFEVARQRPPRLSAVMCGVATAASTVVTLSRLLSNPDAPAVLVAVLLWTSWLVVPWTLGTLVHVRTAANQRMRQDLASRVALEERMRVAREVHDVAGHGFAVVAMQAGVALLVFDENPAQAKTSLEAIQTTSSKALTELRTMLGAFHRGGEDGAGPSHAVRQAHQDTHEEPVTETALNGLAELVDSVRAGGLAVDLDIERTSTALEATVDHAAYRVVQESLTNVLRHAGPTRARVTVRVDAHELVVEVTDWGRGADPEADLPAAGRGLTGMRTRVEAAGGQFSAGARQGGGFHVVARLPLDAGGSSHGGDQ